MTPLRRHLNYANVVATLALVFAMSGGALAAGHYLINSTKQINPKVLKKLKGNVGPRGHTGANGTNGAAGANGATGPEGAKGSAGQSALSPLPSGQSESGDYGIGFTGGTAGEFVSHGVSFPVPLEEGAPSGQVIYTKTSTPVTHCGGPGHADKGFVCIYSFNRVGLEAPSIFSAEGSVAVGGTGRFGFIMEWKVTAAHPFDWGTYTVTAG
jgi:hypothetical protein